MSLDFITKLYIPIVMVACLCVGYVIKKWLPTDNKYIPTLMLVLGAVLGCVANKDIGLDFIVAGAVTGLASTGLHQVFTQIIEHPTAGSESGSNYADDHEANDPEDAVIEAPKKKVAKKSTKKASKSESEVK